MVHRGGCILLLLLLKKGMSLLVGRQGLVRVHWDELRRCLLPDAHDSELGHLCLWSTTSVWQLWLRMLHASVRSDRTVALLLLRLEHLLARLLAVVGGVWRAAKLRRLELLI